MRAVNGKRSDFLDEGYMILPTLKRSKSSIDFDYVHTVASELADLYKALCGTARQEIALTSESPRGDFFDVIQSNGFVRIGMSYPIIPLLLAGSEEDYGRLYDLGAVQIGQRIGNSNLPHGVLRDSSIRLFKALREPARVMDELLLGVGITEDGIKSTSELNSASTLFVALTCYKKAARVNGIDDDHRDNFPNAVVVAQQTSPRPSYVVLGGTKDTLQTVIQQQGETLLMNCFPDRVGSVQRPIHNFFVPDCENVGVDEIVRTSFLCVIQGPLAREFMARQRVIVPPGPRSSHRLLARASS